MQIVKNGFLDPKKVTLYGDWGHFTRADVKPKKDDLVKISVFVDDLSKNTEKTKVPSASNGLEAREDGIGAYVEVNARVLGKSLAPHIGRVFLRQGNGSYREVNGSDKPGAISLKIESESDFPNLHGKVVFGRYPVY